MKRLPIVVSVVAVVLAIIVMVLFEDTIWPPEPDVSIARQSAKSAKSVKISAEQLKKLDDETAKLYAWTRWHRSQALDAKHRKDADQAKISRGKFEKLQDQFDENHALIREQRRIWSDDDWPLLRAATDKELAVEIKIPSFDGRCSEAPCLLRQHSLFLLVLLLVLFPSNYRRGPWRSVFLDELRDTLLQQYHLLRQLSCRLLFQ